MVNAVSSATSERKIRAMDKVTQEQLYDPGLYAMQELYAPPSYREKHGFLKFLSKIVLAAIVVGGGSILARKYVTPLNKANLDVTGEVSKEAKFSIKAKYYFAKFADWTEKNTIGLFGRSKKTKTQK